MTSFFRLSRPAKTFCHCVIPAGSCGFARPMDGGSNKVRRSIGSASLARLQRSGKGPSFSQSIHPSSPSGPNTDDASRWC
jgi:hypothetical protein